MSSMGLGMLILCCLPTIGFALRGIALLCKTRARPGRVITVTGIVAMFSVWILGGVTPFIVAEFRTIFDEFEVDLPWMTELAISHSEWSLSYWFLWYPFVLGLSLLALTVPEIFFGRRQGK